MGEPVILGLDPKAYLTGVYWKTVLHDSLPALPSNQECKGLASGYLGHQVNSLGEKVMLPSRSPCFAFWLREARVLSCYAALQVQSLSGMGAQGTPDTHADPQVHCSEK